MLCAEERDWMKKKVQNWTHLFALTWVQNFNNTEHNTYVQGNSLKVKNCRGESEIE